MKILMLIPLLLMAVLTSNQANAYTVCACPPDDKPYVECAGSCPATCKFVSSSPGDHPHCSNKPPYNPSKGPDCGQHWSDYKNIGEGVGNPCPRGCTRGDAVEYRGSIQGLPPRPVFSEKFQCYGVPKKIVHCYDRWTGWYGSGGGVGNPCPADCPIRGRELGKDHRSVGFPPRLQDKTKFQCLKEVDQ